MTRNDLFNDHEVLQYASRAPSGEECSEASYSKSESVHETVCHDDYCEAPRAPCRKDESSEKSQGCATCEKKSCDCSKCLKIAICQLKDTIKYTKHHHKELRRQAKHRKSRYENEFAGPYGDVYQYGGCGHYFNPNDCPRGFTGVRSHRKCDRC